ncbi:hypothetical protein SCA6_011143 [Theobroma cacao]
MKIVEEVIQEMKVPVILLNVTRLTNFRKDGHPSIFGKRLTEGKKDNLQQYGTIGMWPHGRTKPGLCSWQMNQCAIAAVRTSEDGCGGLDG